MSSTKLSKGRLKMLLNIMMLPIYLLTFLVPKNSKLLVLGSSRGQGLSDNSKYFYLYLKSLEKKNVQIHSYYFITKDKKTYSEAKDKDIIYMYSIKGLITLIRARHAIITHSLDDLVPFLLGGKIIHQLWHGTPLKKIGLDSDSWGDSQFKDLAKQFLYKVFPYLNYMHCTYLYTSSEFVNNSMSTAFGIKSENIKPLGQPRNGYLLELVNDYSLWNEGESIFTKYEKIISWLPTHRGFSGKTITDMLNDYGFEKEEFNNRLKREGYLFVIKPHFVELQNLKEVFKDCENIWVYEQLDPYPLINKTEILITDYSSILFDYLLLNRRAIFAPFDYDFYVENISELYYEYEEIAYGDIACNWKEVLNLIFEEEDIQYSLKRKKLFEKFCAADRDSAQKIYNFIESN
ncbi:CDP-glycerol glycerophosphotransferase family protein [Priestia megaterium]|uniref:CDP-glycerol glycerophosphotransferase family protein n=1 Tax=Priestia megaterium TaxID=1404 RepID=UPI000BF9943A|nr:CDP-glycerol glycerophosphotransferase family protein [Priestia megaterium]PFR92338.1 glycerophosphotransferase [Priestia megaterium]